MEEKIVCLDVDDIKPICAEAVRLFDIFRHLLLNQKVTFSYRFLVDGVSASLDSQNTWKVIEAELVYAYGVFYMKAPLFFFFFFFFPGWGFIFRYFSFTSIIFVFVLFHLKERHKHPRIDLIIIYELLVGAILTEIVELFG